MMQGQLFEPENGQIADTSYRFRLWRGGLRPAVNLPSISSDSMTWPGAALRELHAENPHGRILFVMYNPSSDDGRGKPDPTMHSVLHFTTAYGFRRVDVVNLFAYRATESKVIADLIRGHARGTGAPPRPEVAIGGPDADEHIRKAAADVHAVVFAWGALGAAGPEVERVEVARALEVERIVRAAYRGTMPIGCLGYTRSTGDPYHPLYRPHATPILCWRGRGFYPGANHQPPKRKSGGDGA